MCVLGHIWLNASFKNVFIYLFARERQTETESEEAEGKGQADSLLSVECDMGLDLTTLRS